MLSTGVSGDALHPLLELEPDPQHVPVERSVLADGLVDEPVDFADVEHAGAEPPEHGTAALGSEIERQKMSACRHRGFYAGPATSGTPSLLAAPKQHERVATREGGAVPPKQHRPASLRRRRTEYAVRRPYKASFGGRRPVSQTRTGARPHRRRMRAPWPGLSGCRGRGPPERPRREPAGTGVRGHGRISSCKTSSGTRESADTQSGRTRSRLKAQGSGLRAHGSGKTFDHVLEDWPEP